MKFGIRLFITLVAASAGAWAGFSYAKAEVSAGDAIFETFKETASGWLFSDTIGSADAAPIERARVAVGGPLGLSSSEVLYFIALTDNAGRRLNSSCSYLIEGAPIDSRWWSLTLYDSGTQNYVPNDVNRSSWNNAAIPRGPDGSWQISVSSDQGEPNWLPSQSAPDQPFELNLRVYNPSEKTRQDAPNIALPVVVRTAC